MSKLFTVDVMTAAVTCGGCGVVAQVGEVREFSGAVGRIFRCVHCDTAVM